MFIINHIKYWISDIFFIFTTFQIKIYVLFIKKFEKFISLFKKKNKEEKTLPNLLLKASSREINFKDVK